MVNEALSCGTGSRNACELVPIIVCLVRTHPTTLFTEQKPFLLDYLYVLCHSRPSARTPTLSIPSVMNPANP